MKVILFALSLLLALISHATNYYVTATGNDAQAGTSTGTAWATLAKVGTSQGTFNAGDSVLFHTGDVFYGSFTATKAGVHYGTYGGTAKAILSGLTTVSSWTSIGSGIYESNVLPAGTSVNMVLINGKAYAMGRTPDITAANGGYLTFESHTGSSITDNTNPFTTAYNGAMLCVRTSHGSIERGTITSVATNTINHDGSFQYTPINGYGYFVQNSLLTLNQLGEWYYNPTTHKLSVYFGAADPATYTVEVSTIDNIVTTHAGSLTFDNLTFKGANENNIYCDWAAINNNKFTDCRIAYAGINGLSAAGTSGWRLNRCTPCWNNVNGINFTGSTLLDSVTNCNIRNNTLLLGMIQPDESQLFGAALYSVAGLYASDNNIIHNGHAGINANGNNVLVQNNFVDTFCLVLGDVGGVYSFTIAGITYTNRKWINNVVLHGGDESDGTDGEISNFAYYFDNHTQNVTMQGNTGAYCNVGLFIHDSKNDTLIANTFYSNTQAQVLAQHDDGDTTHNRGIYARRNILFSTASTQLIILLQSAYNDFASLGNLDSNYYCRPFDESNIIHTNWFGNTENDYALEDWQATFSKDPNTQKTPFTLSSATDVLFKYTTASPKTLRYCALLYGVDNFLYDAVPITISPYNSLILLKP